MPQELPHPSEPQLFPLQLGVQVDTHCPLLLHELPLAQVPQEPPHPSEPQLFPLQLGVQPDTHWPLPLQL